MKGYTKWILAVFLLFAGFLSPAQTPYIQHLTTDDGLPSNTVYKVFLDSKKFIWFVTDKGVARFDGTNYTYFRKENGLSSYKIFDIAEDSSCRIWFFLTNASFNFFYENTIHNEKNTPWLKELNGNDIFRRIFEDKDKNLYFHHSTQLEFYQLSPQNVVTKTKLANLPLQIRYMNKDNNGDFLFWTIAGVHKLKQGSDRAVIVNLNIRFREFFGDTDGNMYCCVSHYRKVKFEVVRFQQETSFDQIKPIVNVDSELITAIQEDKSGRLWIATDDKGVFCYKNNVLLNHFDIKNAKSIRIDPENNIWISSSKEGVFKISPFYIEHQHFGSKLFDAAGITKICKDDDQNIWLTNGEKVYHLKDKALYSCTFQRNEKCLNQIFHFNDAVLVSEVNKRPYVLKGLHLNESKRIILPDSVIQSRNAMSLINFNKQKDEICSFNDSYLLLFKQNRLFSGLKAYKIRERINYLFYNPDNQLIINARRNYQFHITTKNLDPAFSYFHGKAITGQLTLNDTVQILNIEGDSLFILDNTKHRNLSTLFYLPVNQQIKHLAYHDTTLVISTSKNIFVCENPLKILQDKKVDFNLFNVNFNSITDMLFNNNKLYVSSDDGLTTIPIEDLHNMPVYTPKPYFQSIAIGDQVIKNHTNFFALKSSEHINFTFSCINYSIHPVIYSYKLEGSDVKWNLVKGNNLVLQNLSPGQYYFKLRVQKPGYQWSEPIQCSIIVKGTIWQYPIFYVLLFLPLAGLVFFLVIKRKNRQLSRHELENQMLLLEQKSLQAMMNPHFIFNSLGSIQNYLLHNLPNEASIYLSQFARLIRQNLNAIDSSKISLEEEIDRLQNYLVLERLRMENKFDFNIVMQEELDSDETFIPSMIIQPFVENAIWHGIANLDEKGTINISFKLQNDKSVQIVVEDSGIGFTNAEKYNAQSSQHLKLGVNITRKRLHLLSVKYNIQTGITYSESNPGAPNPGTKVTIIVPILQDHLSSHE